MKIVTYNIQFGLGRDGRFDLERIAQAVDGADVIALQEVERNWQHSGGVDQPEQLGQLLKQYYWVYGPHFDVDASTRNPDGTVINTRRQFGNMILSKTPIHSMRLFPLPKSACNDQHNMTVGMTEAVIDLGAGQAIRVYNAHLSAKSARDRIRQIHTSAASSNAPRPRVARGPAWGCRHCGARMQYPRLCPVILSCLAISTCPRMSLNMRILSAQMRMNVI